jgi:hypothetical protein
MPPMWKFVDRISQQILHPRAQLVIPGLAQRVDCPLRPLALARGLLGRNEAPLYKKFDHRIERAIADLDAFGLVALLQRGGHLVGVHRSLEQQGENRKCERIGGMSECSHFTRARIYGHGYPYSRPNRQNIGNHM